MKKMSTGELQIAERARKHKGEALHSLHHFIDEAMLAESYRQLNKNSSAGVDGENWYEYGIDATVRIPELLRKFKAGEYRAPMIRRVYISKGDGGQRPLGINTVEDKVLQGGVRKVLEPIYEGDFKDFSFGFRPGRSAHRAIEYMYKEVVHKGMRYIIDADLQNYFGSIPHGMLRDFIARRVKDGVIRKMIDKWMKAGILEQGQVTYPEEGTPQGGLVSPLLSNIYLHYVLDEWYSEQIQPLLKGQSFIVRYADDFILGFANKQDAMRVMEILPKRFGKYQLTLHPDKTKLIDLECEKGKGDRSFNFLGFTHYKGLSRRGKLVLKRKTSSKKLTKAITQTEEWIKHNRHRSLKELISELNVKLRGHYSYYGITFNYSRINSFFEEIRRRLQKWLNRRGGKRKWTWALFNTLITRWLPLLQPKIYHSFPIAKPILEEPYAGKPLVRVCGGAGR
jgi:group II intron reverse transcriptase/maturase